MRFLVSILLALFINFSFAQSDNFNFIELNTDNHLKQLESSNIKIGGYGQIDYNQPLIENTKNPGTLDIHRIILFFGYSFSSKWEMITEIEVEHVTEVYIEQAYLSYKLNKYINFKGGLLLIPMGYINEYHEPPLYYGVERPLLDTKVVPSTWREIGVGVFGRIPELSLKYQLYLVNGFLGYNSVAKFDGDDAYRGGRQKGAESIINYPNISSKIELYGIKRLKLGISGYFGKTQSSLLSGITTSNEAALLEADSSVINISMIGIDASFNSKALRLRVQAIYSHNKNTEAYNKFGATDLGKEIFGYYLEASYNVFSHLKTSTQLLPFVRYENFDTQFSVAPGTIKDPQNHRKVWICGINFYPTQGLVLKADYLFIKTDLIEQPIKRAFNLGIGYFF